MIVKIDIDSNNIPPLSPEEKEMLANLDNISDNDIDYSDAPYLPYAKWVREDEKINFKLKIKNFISRKFFKRI